MRRSVKVAEAARVDPDEVEAVLWSSKTLYPVCSMRSGNLVRCDALPGESHAESVDRIATMIVTARDDA